MFARSGKKPKDLRVLGNTLSVAARNFGEQRF
jgi:hypothetical protein